MSLARSVVRWVVLCAGVLASICAFSPAHAATITYEDRCARTVNAVQWTPQRGPIARFVVDTYLSDRSTGMWIGLGRIGTSFWSAEGSESSDACDDCRTLHLVETRADGTRKRYQVDGTELRRGTDIDPSAQKNRILANLWKLAGNKWPADKLTQDYSVVFGHPETSAKQGQPVFAVHVKAKGAFDLRYDYDATTLMCWCTYDWKMRAGR